ncbi:Skp family chaperone for outer membrane proteins [Sphingobium xenophagum]|uniref:Skp family chaperone for outer membrane proteins n=1 Tax=Sphingobium xenophagum TaxID=121428 RepID=A0ABU1WXH1_SPHXE|nr:OmpH family outer membrane protein [Sphingobium xenophagum]MDR7153557.1 Skp family chaperone for outer membrane proteins [Sphingobium xenophagum]
MKTMFKAAALALAPMTAIALTAMPAVAQTKSGIAVVDLEEAVAKSTAYTTAISQMQTTYKPQIDALNTRRTAIEADLKTKGDALQAALTAAGNKPTPAIETQYQQYQQTQQTAQAELQRMGQPIAIARAYVEEQLVAKLDDALKAATAKTKSEIVFKKAATESFGAGADITPAVVTELNALVPSVSITPPAGWQPGGRQAAPASAPAAAPAQAPKSR